MGLLPLLLEENTLGPPASAHSLPRAPLCCWTTLTALFLSLHPQHLAKPHLGTPCPPIPLTASSPASNQQDSAPSCEGPPRNSFQLWGPPVTQEPQNRVSPESMPHKHTQSLRAQTPEGGFSRELPGANRTQSYSSSAPYTSPPLSLRTLLSKQG